MRNVTKSGELDRLRSEVEATIESPIPNCEERSQLRRSAGATLLGLIDLLDAIDRAEAEFA